MQLKTLLGCAALLAVAYSTPLIAGEAGSAAHASSPATMLAFNIPLAATPRRASQNSPDAGGPVVLAQAGEPQINDLEEKIRQLNGKVEDLNFQIIQMQDQMRKQQQDDEFRFEQLEKKHSDAGADSGEKTARVQSSDSSSGDRSSGADVKSIINAPDHEVSESRGAVAEGDTNGQTLGAPPKNFGTIKFDSKGNPVGETVAPDAASGNGARGHDNTVVASLPSTDDPEELYRNSYQFVLSGDYKAAEAGFRAHIKRYPDDPRAADAHFWLGEALLGQDEYRKAAQVFLDANRTYPKSKKAPDMLLKLGISLSAMNQRDIACGTYHEIGERYPHASSALKDRVKQEQALAGC